MIPSLPDHMRQLAPPVLAARKPLNDLVKRPLGPPPELAHRPGRVVHAVDAVREPPSELLKHGARRGDALSIHALRVPTTTGIQPREGVRVVGERRRRRDDVLREPDLRGAAHGADDGGNSIGDVEAAVRELADLEVRVGGELGAAGGVVVLLGEEARRAQDEAGQGCVQVVQADEVLGGGLGGAVDVFGDGRGGFGDPGGGGAGGRGEGGAVG